MSDANHPARISPEKEKEPVQSQQQQPKHKQQQQQQQKQQQQPKPKRAKRDDEKRHPLHHIFEKDPSTEESSEDYYDCVGDNDADADANIVSSSDMAAASEAASDKQKISDLREEVANLTGELNAAKDTLNRERKESAATKRKLEKVTNDKIMLEAENEGLRRRLEGLGDGDSHNSKIRRELEEERDKNGQLQESLDDANRKIVEVLRAKSTLRERLACAEELHEVIFTDQEQDLKKQRHKVCGLRMHVEKLKRSGTTGMIKQEEISEEEDDD